MMTQQAIIRTLLILAGFCLSACGSEKNSEKQSHRNSQSSNDQIPAVRSAPGAPSEPSINRLCNGSDDVGTKRNPVTGKCKNYFSGCEIRQLADQGYTEEGAVWADDVTGACGVSL